MVNVAHHRAGPDTELNDVVSLETKRHRVLVALANDPAGLTDFELADQLGMHRAAARRHDLLKRGHVMDSGVRRPTGLGGNAAVWVITDRGLAALRSS